MKISSTVEEILRYSREARNSDKELLIKMMEHYGLCLTVAQKEIFKAMPSTETVRRIRQKFQEEGKYLPDQKIGKDRKFRGLSMQQRAPQTKPEKIENIIEYKAISWMED